MNGKKVYLMYWHDVPNFEDWVCLLLNKRYSEKSI